jgi:hypothetical protein
MWIVAYRRDAEPADAPRVTHDDRAACMRDVWPRDGGDPEVWERGEPRTMLARTGVNRRARLHALGNAVVPQIPAMIGRQLVGGFSLSAPVAGGFAPYLPTATVAERDNAGGAKPGPVRPCLSTMARGDLWPTPTVCGNHNRKGASATSGDGPATAVKAWPTPSASDDRDHGRIDRGGAIQRRHEAGKQLMLSMVAVDRVWPTPTAHIAKEGGYPAEYQRQTPLLTAQALNDPSRRGTLSPRWVELLMGYPLDWTVA